MTKNDAEYDIFYKFFLQFIQDKINFENLIYISFNVRIWDF